MADLLTHSEESLVTELGVIYGMFCGVVGEGPTRASDLDEVRAHIHALQSRVLQQAAARAYPGKYRLLGGTLPGRNALAEM